MPSHSLATVDRVTNLLLTRHGQSTWNAEGRWQGQADPPLSDLGRAQAVCAARAVGTVDLVVASDLVRSYETAGIIAEQLGVGPVVIETGLREVDAGEWSGLTRAQIEERWPGHLAAERRPPGFEDPTSLRSRVLEALDRLVESYEGASMLVISHSGVIYDVESHLGVDRVRIPNLAGRHLFHDGSRFLLGERVELVDDESLAFTPGQV